MKILLDLHPNSSTDRLETAVLAEDFDGIVDALSDMSLIDIKSAELVDED